MSDLQTLINAAKADGPSVAARAKVWAGVSSAVGAGSALSSGGAATGSAGVVKMLLLGTLLGGTMTVGIGIAALYVGPSRTHPRVADGTGALDLGSLGPAAQAAPAEVAAAERSTSEALLVPSPRSAFGPVVPVMPFAVATEADAEKKVPAVHAAVVRAPPDDALAREASLLAKARDALIRRDALSALQIVRGLHVLPSRQLVPEELAVEAQALRELGLDREADIVDATLHADFPDSVLGR